VQRVPSSKIAVPELPPGFTPRPELLAYLDRAEPHQLVAVIAPPGYGKTLLLADWVRRSGPPTAWVSVDHDDVTPRLWSAILTALAALPVVPVDSLLHRLAHSGSDSVRRDLVEDLIAALDELGTVVRLILDDVHDITARELLGDLSRLVQHRPATLRLILSSRTDPPIALPRLRLKGELHELRADRLRFSADDAATLMRSAGLRLTSYEIERLHSRTEGWVAGLRLATIALRHTSDTGTFIAQFSGDERSVADYLTSEVLSRLPTRKLDFLRATSVCARMPAGLAVALTERPDAAKILDDLGRETALVERTGTADYRIHSLLRTYLEASLLRHSPALHHNLNGVAARWWTDEPAHALRHAERAGDRELIIELLHRMAIPLLLRGQAQPVRRGLDAVGPTGRSTNPWLALISALVHIDERDLPAAAADLHRARHLWPDGGEPELDLLRASVEILGPGLGLLDVDDTYRPIQDQLNAPELEALWAMSRGVAVLGPGHEHDFDLASQHLDQAVRLARTHDFGYLEVQALSVIATLAGERADHRGMVRAASEAISAASRLGRHPSAWTSGASAMLAYADLLAGDTGSARTRAQQALDTVDALPAKTPFALRAVLGCARADAGDSPGGLADMRSARAEAGDLICPQGLQAAMALLEHRTALLLGNPSAADDVREWLERRVGRAAEVLVMEAWTAAASGRYEAARAVVIPITTDSAPLLLQHTSIEVLLINAEAKLRADDITAGIADLDAALTMGETIGILRPFAYAGQRTRDQLPGRPAARGSGQFAKQLAAVCAAISAQPVTLLSAAETAVLALLPSLLNANQIAAELVISVNTVKTHIRSIYGKLGASTRREAVLRARERGLLP
jgi:LuxR family transcriptional regulator, maltose regulon positive regulatory protein